MVQYIIAEKAGPANTGRAVPNSQLAYQTSLSIYAVGLDSDAEPYH